MSARVLVISEDPVGSEMGGNAIRAYELAKALVPHADVTLAAPPSSGMAPDLRQVVFDREDPRALRGYLRGVDVVVTLPQNPVVTAQLRHSKARLLYDLYDPKPLQLLEAFAAAPTATQHYWSTIALDHTLEALRIGDHFICASERQRDLWIGAMLGGGLITPAVYRADQTLRSVIDVVPFGVPAEPPSVLNEGPYECFPALQRDAEIVLWNGGLWNWLDPVCAVEAIALVIERRPRARLVFMGRPPLDERQAEAATAARRRAAAIGLLDEVVFFNDGWVPYRERGAWLLAADCALSLHIDHLETHFSFRTRLLDCFWAGLPVVCTGGDELAGRVARDGLGETVAGKDPQAAADAIERVLDLGRSAYRDALTTAAADYEWSKAVQPLIRFACDPPVEFVRRRPRVTPPGRLARATGTRVLRALLRTARRLSFR